MRITAVVMSFLTPRLKLQLRSVSFEAPGHQVQNILRELAASPLVAVDDRQVQGDGAEGLAGDPVTVDALVALAGPGQDALCLGEHSCDIIWLGLQDVFKRPLGTSHFTNRPGMVGRGADELPVPWLWRYDDPLFLA